METKKKEEQSIWRAFEEGLLDGRRNFNHSKLREKSAQQCRHLKTKIKENAKRNMQNMMTPNSIYKSLITEHTQCHTYMFLWRAKRKHDIIMDIKSQKLFDVNQIMNCALFADHCHLSLGFVAPSFMTMIHVVASLRFYGKEYLLIHNALHRDRTDREMMYDKEGMVLQLENNGALGGPEPIDIFTTSFQPCEILSSDVSVLQGHTSDLRRQHQFRSICVPRQVDHRRHDVQRGYNPSRHRMRRGTRGLEGSLYPYVKKELVSLAQAGYELNSDILRTQVTLLFAHAIWDQDRNGIASCVVTNWDYNM
ncbi:unnamed protein product [Lupinus luteus]|uniref:Uncharacterized protein n=1 Tax=Lupinus luteus TaxID=3873 RepID=A0AAV1XX24_LUPLU